MKTETDFARNLTKFLSEYLPHERCFSPKTVTTYSDSFKIMIRYIRDITKISLSRFTLSMFTPELVKDFLSWLVDSKGNSASTRNNRLAAISSFAQYLQYQEVGLIAQWQSISAIKALKTDRPSISYISVEAVRLLLEQPDLSTPKGRRDVALLALMYDSGARVQEIINLRPSDIRITNRPYTIKLYGKGRKSRIVPLSEQQCSLLREYMLEKRLFDEDKADYPLFCNKWEKPLTRPGITYLLQEYVRMASAIDKTLFPANITPHCLRHSKAMHLLQADVNIIQLRDFLGHVSIQTTDVYARAEGKKKREALEKAYADTNPEILKSKRDWEEDPDLLEWLERNK